MPAKKSKAVKLAMEGAVTVTRERLEANFEGPIKKLTIGALTEFLKSEDPRLYRPKVCGM